MAEQNNEQRGVVGALLAMVAGLLLLPLGLTGLSTPGGTRVIDRDEQGADVMASESQSDGASETVGAKNQPIWLLDECFAPYARIKASTTPAASGKSLHVPTDKEPWTSRYRDSFAAGVTITPLILCIADPDSSSVGYRTDLALDALQKTLIAQPEKWVIDRWHIPWKGSKSSGVGTRHEPGVLVFRRTAKVEDTDEQSAPPSRQLLAVYLVGELMTSGVDELALVRALEHALSVSERAGKASGTIPILGPVFTGSVESLAYALVRAREKIDGLKETPPCVINWSALGFDYGRFDAIVNTAFGSDLRRAATVTGFEGQKKALFEYLSARGEYRRIAWLTEAGTGFGASAKPTEDTETQPVTSYSFPTGIAQVRDAYAKAAGAAQGTTISSPTDRTLLAFPAESRSDTADVLPRLVPGMLAPYAELMLRTMLLDIAREDFDAVGITATDHRDRMFLVEQIRRHAPQAQIILIGGDLAHDHPTYRRSMLGALVVSAYPPFSAIHTWPVDDGSEKGTNEAPPPAPRYARANSGVNALGNAVSIALDIASGRNEFTTTGKQEDEDVRLQHSLNRPLDAFGPPSTAVPGDKPPTRPPLWLSIVGYQGAWPLQWKECTDGKVVAIPPSPRRNGRLELPGLHRNPTQLTRLVVLMTMLGFLIAGAIRGWFGTGRNTLPQPSAALIERHWKTFDEWVLPFACWCPDGSDSDRRWRLGGPLLAMLFALWIPTSCAMAVTWSGVAAGRFRSLNEALTSGDWLAAWLLAAILALAPWPIGNPGRFLLFVLSVAATMLLAPFHDAVWLLLVAMLAGSAAVHLLANGLFVACQWARGQRPGVVFDGGLTALACLVQVAVVVGMDSSFGDKATRFPWLLTCAWILNGISPLLPITATGLALAAIWTVELVRGWWLETFVIDPQAGVGTPQQAGPTSPSESDQDWLTLIRYPLLGTSFGSWLTSRVFGLDRADRSPTPPENGADGTDQPTPAPPSTASALSFVLVTFAVGWLVLVAGEIGPVYPVSAVHHLCIGLLFLGYLSWALLFVRTGSLINLLFGHLERFRHEIGDPDQESAFKAAFAALRRPADVSLGRLLYSARPPVSEIPDRFTGTERRVVGMKRFIRAIGAQIRFLLAGLAVGAVLLFVAATGIPCQPRSLLVLTGTGAFLAFALLVVRTLLRIESDTVLSLVAGTTAGRIGWDWSTITRIALPVAIPLLLVLGQAFPDAWQWVGALVEGWRGS